MIDIAVLRAAGLSDAQIVRVLELDGSERKLKRREQNRINKQNQRSRQHVSNVSADPLPPFPLKEKVSPTPPLKENTLFPPTPDAREARCLRRPDWPADYGEQFWRQYPHKVGKGAALKSLDRIALAGQVPWVDLMGAEQRYGAKTDDRPWCNPATWLNQQRWLDQPATNGGNGNGKPKHETLAEQGHRLAADLRAKMAGADDTGRGDDGHDPDAVGLRGSQFQMFR